MKCYRCSAEMIWGSDFTFDDYGIEGEGIVATFSCPECPTTAEFYMSEESVDDPVHPTTEENPLR